MKQQSGVLEVTVKSAQSNDKGEEKWKHDVAEFVAVSLKEIEWTNTSKHTKQTTNHSKQRGENDNNDTKTHKMKMACMLIGMEMRWEERENTQIRRNHFNRQTDACPLLFVCSCLYHQTLCLLWLTKRRMLPAAAHRWFSMNLVLVMWALRESCKLCRFGGENTQTDCVFLLPSVLMCGMVWVCCICLCALKLLCWHLFFYLCVLSVIIFEEHSAPPVFAKQQNQR